MRIEFGPGGSPHANLSGAAFSGEWLWVVGDEGCAIERLRPVACAAGETLRFGDARSFALADLLDLPGAADEEADLEGIAVDGDWLWLAGSHSLKRKNAKPGRDDADNARRLGKLARDGNRFLLARVPIAHDAQGAPTLLRRTDDGRRAERLQGDAKRSLLTRALADDPHLAPFLGIPGKDNGFDIEGLAVLDSRRLLLGLRGPVLRGWTLLLEIAVRAGDKWLHLEPLDDAGTLVRKHFLQLEGMGVRDLHFVGDDLYLLVGPTMVLDGDIRLVRWAGARQAITSNGAPVRFQTSLDAGAHLPHGRGTDRAEAFCELPQGLRLGAPCWLVLYDSPDAARRCGDNGVLGDLLERG